MTNPRLGEATTPVPKPRTDTTDDRFRIATEGILVGNRYRLDQPAGRGRSGVIWQAFDTRLHRTVAAKQLPLPPDADEQATARLFQQGQSAARIRHDYAMAVHDVVRHEQQVWMIMEYVPSRTMAEFLAEYGTLTPDQVSPLGQHLADALLAAHDCGVVHGTLDPSCVLLADDGSVRVTDIGIATTEVDPGYRAPELATGAAATPASDAFSLAALLYAAVEGVPPYGADGRRELHSPRQRYRLHEVLLPLLNLNPRTRPSLAAFRRTLADENAPTVTEQPTDFTTAWTVRVPHPPPAAAPTRPGNNRKASTRTWLIGVGAVLLAVLIGVLFAQFVLL